MSVGSLQSNPWATSQSTTDAPGASAPTGPYVEVSQEQATFSTSATLSNGAPVSANPLQSLASDIQAMLIQAQSTSAASGVTQASPEQNLATDLQSLMAEIQSATTQSGTTPNAQTANSNPTAPAGQTEHHHHHHHGDGDDASGASDVANASTSSDGAVATSGSQLASDQAASSIFATDIAQAIQAYGGASAAAVMPALMV